jgi:hypothetical protein
LKSGSSRQLTACSPYLSRHAFRQTGHALSTWNKESSCDIWGYVVRYSIRDICWPKPSIEIARRKSWAWAACKHPKTTFCLMVNWS